VVPLLISVTSPALATLAKVACVTCRREGISSDYSATAVGLVYPGGASFDVDLIDGGVVRARPIAVSIVVTLPNAL
jgi:hypothetical protein